MPNTFGVVDLFAGPGGLGEGFASLTFDGHSPFRIGISIEKEVSAHRTLEMRAFLRDYKARHGKLPEEFLNLHSGKITDSDWESLDVRSWKVAKEEARCLELGTNEASQAINRAIKSIRSKFDDTILIGGPPCQAYSLVGRARSKGKLGYIPEKDERHYLFREYIQVLDRLRPAAFVMENVKGILSSTIESRLVFEMLLEDLASLGTRRGHQYELRAIRVEDASARLERAYQPSDFIVRSEQFGIPQRRHRVIIIGIRADLSKSADKACIRVPLTQRTVADVIGKLPAIRSGLSQISDSNIAWDTEVTAAAKRLASLYRRKKNQNLFEAFKDIEQRFSNSYELARSANKLPKYYGKSTDSLLQWLERPEIKAIAQHEARGHMSSDLERYLFSAVYGQTLGCSPKACDFPLALSPNHANWHSGVFSDRFRVQLAHQPSTTITSHISKDGHYFIHPDPMQCRSLTVREAARLQTFPDDYLFLGNRTQQYVQVGNAVPPYLARQIASLLSQVLSIAAVKDHSKSKSKE